MKGYRKRRIIEYSRRVLAVLLCIAVCMMAGCGKKTDWNGFESYISQEDFDAAQKFYNGLSGEEKMDFPESVVELIRQKAAEIEDSYYAGEISYDTAVDELERLGDISPNIQMFEIRDMIEQIAAKEAADDESEITAEDPEETEPETEPETETQTEVHTEEPVPQTTADTELTVSAEAYNAGILAMANNSYKEAAVQFAGVIARDPNYAAAVLLREKALDDYKDEVLKNVEQLEADQEFETAVALLSELQMLRDDEEIGALIAYYNDILVNGLPPETTASSEAETEPQTEVQTEAEVPDTVEVQKVYLSRDIAATETGCTQFADGDSYYLGGNAYTVGIVDSQRDRNVRAVYALNGEYDQFCGLYGALDGAGEAETIYIYGDDYLLGEYYTSLGMLPQEFCVDVTGVQQLQITFNRGYGSAAIVNAFLCKGEAEVHAEYAPMNLPDEAHLSKDISSYRTYSSQYNGQGSERFYMGGNEYNVGFVDTQRDRNVSVFYNLNGEYRQFCGLYGALDGAGESETISMYGDGYLLGEFYTQLGMLPQEFRVDVTGVKQLQIVFNRGYGSSAIANAVFSKSETPLAVEYASMNLPDEAYLSRDITSYRTYSSQYNGQGSERFYMGGNAYNIGFVDSQRDRNVSVFYNLNGEYKQFCGLYGALDGAGETETISVYGDGYLLEEFYTQLGMLPQEFRIDVTGVKQLWITFDRGYGSSALANAFLTKSEEEVHINNPMAERDDMLYIGKDIVAYRTYSTQYSGIGRDRFYMGGNEYALGLVDTQRDRNVSAFFNLDGEYKQFCGLYGALDGAGETETISIYGDGYLLEEFHTQLGMLPQEFCIDVTGVEQLQVTFDRGYGSSALANAFVTKSEEEVHAEFPEMELKDEAYLSKDISAYRSYSSQYDGRGSERFSMGGKQYNVGIVGSQRDRNVSLFYNLNGEYATFSGLYGTLDGAGEAETICIYGDGELLEDLPTTIGMLPKEFEVDVTDVKQLQIVFDRGYGNSGIAEGVLKKAEGMMEDDQEE